MTKTTETSKVCFGLTSISKGNLHTFMIDYDDNNYKLFRKHIIDIQYEHKLSDLYTFKTKNGFHAMTLDKLEIDYIKNILCNCELVDTLYISLALIRGFFVLRWGNDKEFIEIIHSKNNMHIKSFAHFLFLAYVLKLDLITYPNMDTNTEIETIAYKSGKHGWSDFEI